jgi:hypothetical protein
MLCIRAPKNVHEVNRETMTRIKDPIHSLFTLPTAELGFPLGIEDLPRNRRRVGRDPELLQSGLHRMKVVSVQLELPTKRETLLRGRDSTGFGNFAFLQRTAQPANAGFIKRWTLPKMSGTTEEFSREPHAAYDHVGLDLNL